MKSENENTISVFDTLNDASITARPSDIIFNGPEASYIVTRMEGDKIVIQLLDQEGNPDPQLPRFKFDRDELRAQGFTLKVNNSSQ